ncbi:MAG TPA: outer membrane beta-barrel protein [Xanthobacteraceae bacterium]|nr:outer membrane beta-barrel protein [Xanthobacteraceae bacterium]
MKKILAACIVAAAFCAPAFAADMPVKAPVSTPAAFDWSGFYVGGSLGYQDPRIKLVNPNFPASAIQPHDPDGIYGGHIGLQKQFGAFVLGVEGGLQDSFLRSGGNVACNGPNAGLAPGIPANCQARMKDVWTIGGRAGWAAGNWMPYISGGYANGAFDYHAISLAGSTFEQAKTRLGGSYIGGGLDWMLSPHWTLGVEYRHYQFDHKLASAFGTGGGGFPAGVFTEPVQFGAKADTVSARLSYRWGWM